LEKLKPRGSFPGKLFFLRKNGFGLWGKKAGNGLTQEIGAFKMAVGTKGFPKRREIY